MLWDGVIPAGVEWITTQDPPGCHERSFEGTMLIYGLIAIMGAGWIEPAGIGRQPGRDQLLVRPDHCKNKNTRNIPKRTRHISQARFMGIIMQDKLLFRVLVDVYKRQL